MKNDINLLNTKTKSPLSSFANKVDIIRTIAVFSLFLVAILSVTFFFLVLVSPLPSLRREENAKKLALRSLYGKITDLYIVNDRVKGVSTVLDKRSKLDEILGELLNNMPTAMEVQSIKSTKGEVSMDVSSPSLPSVQNYIQALVEDNNNKKLFSSITQSSLTLSSNSNKAQVHITFTF